MTLEAQVKTCSRCLASKDLSEFSKRSDKKDGLDYYCRQCKRELKSLVSDRDNQRRRERYWENHEVELASMRKWQTENRELMRESCRNWRANNPDAQYLASLNWARNNPHKRAAAQVKREASKKLRTPVWLTRDDLLNIEFFYELSEAMTRATGVQHSVDHIVPMQGESVSGLHVPWNLQVIPKGDNSRKGNRYVCQ